MYKIRYKALVSLFSVALVITPSAANAYFDLSQIQEMFVVLQKTVGSENAFMSFIEGSTEKAEDSTNKLPEEYKAKNTTRTITLIVTAYSSSRDETDEDPFTTAAGTTVREGIVATNFLPFGTKIKIPEHFGDKVFVVEDRMNRRFKDRVDIWFPSKMEARNFGKKTSNIIVLES